MGISVVVKSAIDILLSEIHGTVSSSHAYASWLFLIVHCVGFHHLLAVIVSFGKCNFHCHHFFLTTKHAGKISF
jgi:hypothetical protein